MTSPSLIALNRLRHLAAALAEGEMPMAEDAAWLADKLERYFADAERGLSLEIVLGLSPTQGERPWWDVERLDNRDVLLRDMATRHFPGQRPGPASKAITAAWRRDCRNRRAIDRRHGETTAADGTLDAALFALGQLGGPPGWRRVRDILANDDQADAA